MPFKSFPPLGAATLILALAGWSSAAVTTNWKTNSNGSFTTAANWDNGVPGANDTAQFSRSGAYTVTFPGNNPTFQLPRNYTIHGLIVGLNAVTFANAAGREATLTLDNLLVDAFGADGATLSTAIPMTAATAKIGAAGEGTLNVIGRTLTVTGDSANDAELIIGDGGDGRMNVAGGADVLMTGPNANAAIGFAANSIGSVLVTGIGSTWNSGPLSIGVGGESSLDVQFGGSVSSDQTVLAEGAGSHGVASVSGPGSTWNVNGALEIGLSGDGRMTIDSGGQSTCVDAYVGFISEGRGEVTIQGTGSAWTISHQLFVGFKQFGSSVVDIKPGGKASVGQDTTIDSGGRVRLEGGELGTTAVNFAGSGQFQWISGTLHVGTYHGNLINPVGGVLAPGHPAGSTLITGNYTQQSGGGLEIEIGGSGQGTQFDFVNVIGTALIGGKLTLSLINGFTPASAQTFTVMSAASLLNSFSNVTDNQRLFTSDGRGSFVVRYGPTSSLNPNQVVLTSFLLAADFDNDGDVDAADLAKWKLGFGASSGATHMQGDADADGDVDGGDLLVWQRQLGSTSMTYLATAAVPEPATLALFIVAAPGIRRAGRRTRQKLVIA